MNERTAIRQNHNDSLFLGVFVLVYLFPQLPPIFNRSELHINFLILTISIFVFLRFPSVKLQKRQLEILAIYFITLQVLLLLSAFISSPEISSLNILPSLIRPLFWFVVSMSISHFVVLDHRFYRTLLSSIKVVVFLNLLFATAEIFFFDQVQSFIHFFYKDATKTNIQGVAVTTFGLPYFHSYVMSIFIPFLLLDFNLRKAKTSLWLGIAALASVVLSQSKVGIAVAVLVLFLSMAPYLSLVTRWLLILSGAGFGVYVWMNLPAVASFLLDNFPGPFAHFFYQLGKGITPGSYWVRVGEIVDFSQEVFLRGGIGLGVGKGETIESWIAYTLYRYGFVGIAVFIGFFGWLSIYLFRTFSHNRVYLAKSWQGVLTLSTAIWSLAIFVSQLSSLSMDYSKAGFYTCVMLVLGAKLVTNRSSIVPHHTIR